MGMRILRQQADPAPISAGASNQTAFPVRSKSPVWIMISLALLKSTAAGEIRPCEGDSVCVGTAMDNHPAAFERSLWDKCSRQQGGNGCISGGGDSGINDASKRLYPCAWHQPCNACAQYTGLTVAVVAVCAVRMVAGEIAGVACGAQGASLVDLND